MKVKLIIASVIITILGSVVLWFFNSNTAAKKFGGSLTIKLKEDKKFINVTWKEDELWVLTRKRHSDEKNPETYEFREDSGYGLVEGKVTFIEKFSNNVN